MSRKLIRLRRAPKNNCGGRLEPIGCAYFDVLEMLLGTRLASKGVASNTIISNPVNVKAIKIGKNYYEVRDERFGSDAQPKVYGEVTINFDEVVDFQSATHIDEQIIILQKDEREASDGRR